MAEYKVIRNQLSWFSRWLGGFEVWTVSFNPKRVKRCHYAWEAEYYVNYFTERDNCKVTRGVRTVRDNIDIPPPPEPSIVNKGR